ncbi:MAG: VPLPA-CTERM sorting domain-containing protein [Nitrospira sp.]
MCNRTPLLTVVLLFVAGILPVNSQASLINVGNGLIYDNVSDVTWISNGLTFPNDIAATTANPTANPYTGPLLGTVVTPSLGTPHTIAANDLSYEASLGRWVGSWWAATAWADGFTSQHSSQAVSDWRLPTSAEAQTLITQLNQLGTGRTGAAPPFDYIPPFFWTSTLTSETNVNFSNMLSGTIANRTLFDAAAGRPAYSNVMIVAPGNIAPVPLPAAAWLFGSGVAGLIGLARRRRCAQEE